jgi:hypothetical protein
MTKTKSKSLRRQSKRNDAVQELVLTQLKFFDINCNSCYFYMKDSGCDINEAKNRFLHQIGIHEGTKFIAPCNAIISESTDGKIEIGFADNFACKSYSEENSTTFLIKSELRQSRIHC